MICSNCHQPLDDGAAFCGNCGQPVANNAAPSPQAPGQAVPPASPAMPQQPVVPTGPLAPQPQPQTNPVALSPSPAVVVNAMPPTATGAYDPTAIEPKKGEVKAIIGLILGIASVPGSIIPLLGLVLGIVAVVVASLSIRVKKVMAILAFVFAGIGIVISILLWIYAIAHDPRLHNQLSSNQQTVNTPCYKFDLSSSLKVTQNGCEINALNGSEGSASVALVIQTQNVPNLTASNLDQIAKEAGPSLASGASQGSGATATITSQYSGSFVGNPAYYFNIKDNRGDKSQAAMVYYDLANGDNTFLIIVASRNGTVDSISSLESNFAWK